MPEVVSAADFFGLDDGTEDVSAKVVFPSVYELLSSSARMVFENECAAGIWNDCPDGAFSCAQWIKQGRGNNPVIKRLFKRVTLEVVVRPEKQVRVVKLSIHDVHMYWRARHVLSEALNVKEVTLYRVSDGAELSTLKFNDIYLLSQGSGLVYAERTSSGTQPVEAPPAEILIRETAAADVAGQPRPGSPYDRGVSWLDIISSQDRLPGQIALALVRNATLELVAKGTLDTGSGTVRTGFVSARKLMSRILRRPVVLPVVQQAMNTTRVYGDSVVQIGAPADRFAKVYGISNRAELYNAMTTKVIGALRDFTRQSRVLRQTPEISQEMLVSSIASYITDADLLSPVRKGWSMLWSKDTETVASPAKTCRVIHGDNGIELCTCSADTRFVAEKRKIKTKVVSKSRSEFYMSSSSDDELENRFTEGGVKVSDPVDRYYRTTTDVSIAVELIGDKRDRSQTSWSSSSGEMRMHKHAKTMHNLSHSNSAMSRDLADFDEVNAIGAQSQFSKEEHSIMRKEGYSKDRAAAITAAAGRKHLGQAEMTRRSVAGRKAHSKRVGQEAVGAVRLMATPAKIAALADALGYSGKMKDLESHASFIASLFSEAAAPHPEGAPKYIGSEQQLVAISAIAPFDERQRSAIRTITEHIGADNAATLLSFCAGVDNPRSAVALVGKEVIVSKTKTVVDPFGGHVTRITYEKMHPQGRRFLEMSATIDVTQLSPAARNLIVLVPHDDFWNDGQVNAFNSWPLQRKTKTLGLYVAKRVDRQKYETLHEKKVVIIRDKKINGSIDVIGYTEHPKHKGVYLVMIKGNHRDLL